MDYTTLPTQTSPFTNLESFPVVSLYEAFLGVRNVARQMRYFDAESDQALDLILTGQCSVY